MASVTVGITNTRLNAAKRGIAVELATRLGRATGAAVCLVGADSGDHDVERRLTQLSASDPRPRRLALTRGARSLAVTSLDTRRLCVVTVTDRLALAAALPRLQEEFGHVVIDAPSRVGDGVGIARVLMRSLDRLLVASGFRVDELTETRRYVEWLGEQPAAQHVAVAVVLSGDRSGSHLGREQLASRLAALPVAGCVPRLWGGAEPSAAELDTAFAPLLEWVEHPPPAGADRRVAF